MKRTEIQTGSAYTNGGPKGMERLVLSIGEGVERSFPYAIGVRFKYLNGTSQGKESTITLESFAQWAKKEIPVLRRISLTETYQYSSEELRNAHTQEMANEGWEQTNTWTEHYIHYAAFERATNH